jgi:hypothetical protein
MTLKDDTIVVTCGSRGLGWDRFRPWSHKAQE